MSAAAISTAQLRDFANAFRASFGQHPMSQPETSAETPVEQPTEEVPVTDAADAANEDTVSQRHDHDATMAEERQLRDVVLEVADELPPVRRTAVKAVTYAVFGWAWLKSAVKSAVQWTRDKIKAAYTAVVNCTPVRYVSAKIRAAYDWISAQVAAGHAKMKEYRWYAYICEKLDQGYAYVKSAAVSSYQWTKAKVSAALSWVWAQISAFFAMVRSGMLTMGNWIISGLDRALATVRGWFGTTKAVVTAAVAAGATAAAMATAPATAPEAPVAPAAAQTVQDTEEQQCNALFFGRAVQPNVREVKFDAGWGNEDNGFAGMITGESAIRVALNAEQQLTGNDMRVGETLRTVMPNKLTMLIVGTRMGPVAVFSTTDADEPFAITATEELGNSGALNLSGKITLQDLQAILGRAASGNDAGAPNIGERMEEILAKMVQATPGR